MTAETSNAREPDVAMALHWIDRYAAGIDDECQIDLVADALGVTLPDDCAPEPSQQPGPKPEARGVVDEGSRSVTRQLLHWGGVPVHVTGTVTTSSGNWSLIDAALAASQQQGGGDLDDVVCLACGDHIMPMGQLCHACSHPVSAPPSAPVGVDMERFREPVVLWGKAYEYDRHGREAVVERRKPIVDELLAIIDAAAQQPAAMDGAYPTPRNRAEAVALARLALAYLGVIDAHIDAAVARCETDLATQHQEPKP